MTRGFILGLVLVMTNSVLGQVYDLLPDITPSPFHVRAKLFATGLPVESEMVTEVFVQRVGPTDLAPVPNGSGDLVVSTYGGTAFRLSTDGAITGEPLLQLNTPGSASVNANFDIGGAHGFNSIAFHPEFGNDQHQGYAKFYTIESEKADSGSPDFVTSTESGRHHDDAVYEYTLENAAEMVCNAVCAGSKRELMRVLQPGWHHNLGDLEFTPDGLLYIASADGSTSRKFEPFMSDNSQALTTIFGNILRIDPLGSNSLNGQYGIPPSNPFVLDPGALDEVFAYGFRNPYRLNFDTESNKLYTTDTGESRIESAYEVVPGGNHGWNRKEGSLLYDKTTKQVSPDLDLDNSGVGDVAEANGFVEPIFEYDRDFGRAIIGTVMYHDPYVPYLDESLVFGDFDGRLYYGDTQTGKEHEFSLTADSDSIPFQIHSVNEDLFGSLYVLGIQRTAEGFDGVLVKLESCYGEAIPGDFDRSGEVDFADFLVLSRNFGLEGQSFAQGDTNCDGLVVFADFLTLSQNFGQSSTQPVPEPRSTTVTAAFLVGALWLRRHRSAA